MKQLKLLLGLVPILFIVAVIGIYQGCGANFEPVESSGVASLTLDLPISHPPVNADGADTSESTSLQGRVLIGDKKFLESAFRDIFIGPSGSQTIANKVNSILNDELNRAQHLLGQPCDPYVYADLSPCYSLRTNINIKMDARTSSGREAVRLHVCRRMVSDDTILNGLMTRLSVSNSAIVEKNITDLVSEFFPSLEQDDVQEIAESLLELNSQMLIKNESVINRWRLITLTLCESPYWEVL